MISLHFLFAVYFCLLSIMYIQSNDWKCKHLIEWYNKSLSTSKKLAVGVAWKSSIGNWKKKECKTIWLISLTFFETSSPFSQGSGRFAIHGKMYLAPQPYTVYWSLSQCGFLLTSELLLMGYNMHPYGSHITHSKL